LLVSHKNVRGSRRSAPHPVKGKKWAGQTTHSRPIRLKGSKGIRGGRPCRGLAQKDGQHHRRKGEQRCGFAPSATGEKMGKKRLISRRHRETMGRSRNHKKREGVKGGISREVRPKEVQCGEENGLLHSYPPKKNREKKEPIAVYLRSPEK